MMTVFETDGILLKPCLLQPCFHMAGIRPPRTLVTNMCERCYIVSEVILIIISGIVRHMTSQKIRCQNCLTNLLLPVSFSYAPTSPPIYINISGTKWVSINEPHLLTTFLKLHIHVCTYTYIYRERDIHTHIYTYTYTYTYTYIYTYTHICI